MSLTPLSIVFIGNFFIFIICLMGVQCCYFRRSWKWFVLMLACVIISGVCIFVEAYQWLGPAPEHDLPLVIRQPTTPL